MREPFPAAPQLLEVCNFEELQHYGFYKCEVVNFAQPGFRTPKCPLPAVCLFLRLSRHHEIGFKEPIYITVHYGIYIAGLFPAAYIFYQFVWVHYIIPDL